MNASSEPMGTVDVALEHAQRLLSSDPTLAIEQAAEILKVVPGHPVATLLLGRALGMAGRGEEAVAALRRAAALQPDDAEAWRLLGDHLTALGDVAGAEEARARQIKASTRDPNLLDAAAALLEGHLATAEAGLREHLKRQPADVAAIRMLAEVAGRLGRYRDAQVLLERCLELAPGFIPARVNYAFVLHREGKAADALREINLLLQADARNPNYRTLKAAILVRIGEYDGAIELYEGILAEYPNHSKVWMSHGHALKTAGRQADAVRAYRRSIRLAPHLGEAYWSLANLKTVRFDTGDLGAMRAQLSRPELADEDRFHFEFALGKALEDLGEYAESFQHYVRGNTRRRVGLSYDAADTTQRVQRSKALFTEEFFAERAGYGCQAPDPIFIVGLPRAGSTLLEQILASHPLVEGTQELPDIISMARMLGGKKTRSDVSQYPEILATLSDEQLRELGERYLGETRIQRKTSAPFFIDKMPNNWTHVGLIHLILPRAKVIDARRHPLACCLSAFKQHFARGQLFTYDLTDVGLYYRDYTDLMAHFDEVLPGRIHRVFYERMVGDFEAEVRRLLAYCGLEFNEKCLFFHENERTVRTASSEQVRRPLFRDALDHWHHYDPWLGDLKQALGPVLGRYPVTQQFPVT